MPRKQNGNGKKDGKILDLNTKILISIRDELRGHRSILQEHTGILQNHSTRLVSLESAVKELAREMRKWVTHFDRDYMRLANEFDAIRVRVEKCEAKLYPET